MEQNRTETESGIGAAWPLDREGFIQHYMVSGPKVEPFSSTERDTNQLRYEAYLRSITARHEPLENTADIRAESPGRLGLPWSFQGGRDGSFVNLSDFYSTMQRVRFDAATALIAEEETQISLTVWGYTAVDLYLNGEARGGLKEPVYKPIGRKKLSLTLKKGVNILYLACETLGVRDTRSVVGLQVQSAGAGLRVTLPDPKMAKETAKALLFLEGAELDSGILRLPEEAPAGTRWAWRETEVDYSRARRPVQWQNADGRKEIPLEDGKTRLILCTPAGNGSIQRVFERTEQIRPKRIQPAPDEETNRELVFRRIAGVESLDRGEFGFPIANMLARKALGCPGIHDDALMEDMLRLIERRVDCADFLVCGLIRYIKNYPVPPKTAARIRQVLTHWRYWMDQDGFDGMCFWSENHCLMFYTGAMLAGEMYPEDDFPLAGKTGRELSAWGRGKVLDWLEDVEKWGFEEFHSTVYMCVTFAALINVIDFAEPEISRRAAALTDQMLRALADHTFKGGIIAPQGRVYRGVLYPFQAGAMALMNLADPEQPYDYGEGWLGMYATSGYRFPQDLRERMRKPASLNYTTGNARIILEKREDWCLTSVQIPREPFQRWENETQRADADPSSHAFVKSYNERFHGTTCFQPGCYGYQQHLWYAALDGEAAVFINHPGSASEGGDMRPGYWHGNGVFPALKQEKNLLGMIWRIPDEHPFHYVHLYWPECRFDEVLRDGNWLLGRKGTGYIGLWASVPFEPWTGVNTRCEQRLWGSEIACLCVCAGREVRNLDAFARQVKALNPTYSAAEGKLQAGDYTLIYVPGQDDTQYL